MKSIILIFTLLFPVLAFGGMSDKELRKRIFVIGNDKGHCTAEQVRGPSGKDYIISASHCGHLADSKGRMEVIDAKGHKHKVKVLAEDPKSDLLLMSPLPHLRGIKIAAKSHKAQHIKTLTHGHVFDTYETLGVVIQDKEVEAPIFEIFNEQDSNRCSSQPKYYVFVAGSQMLCIFKSVETVTTAMIVPGSSGGAILSLSGDLIGVASITDGHFGYYVRLSDIHRFMKHR